MSKSQLNYVNDGNIGKRSVMGLMAPCANGREFRKVKGMDFETVQLGTYAALGAADGTEDLVGKGNNAQNAFYLSTVISDNNIYFYAATDEDETAIANFSTVTISPFASTGSYVESVDVNSGKIVLTDAGVTALDEKYLFASYKYVVPKGNFELERQMLEDAVYIYQSGTGAQQSHAVGNPDDPNYDGNFKFDRKGLIANGTAARTGDIYIVRDRIEGNTFTAFGANLEIFDEDYWEEVIPIAEAVEDKYTKDASLKEGDVVKVEVIGVAGQNITVNPPSPALADDALKAAFPYTMYLVCPTLKVALPISDSNAGPTTISIVSGYSIPAAITAVANKWCYIRRKKNGAFETKNTVFTY